jgi:hypothetical protein
MVRLHPLALAVAPLLGLACTPVPDHPAPTMTVPAPAPPPPAPSAAPHAAEVAPATSAPSAAEKAPFVSTCQAVSFTLATKRISASGVELRAELVNRGSAPIALTRTGDGSVAGARYPTVTFSLTPDRHADPGRCGLINAMTVGDLVTLAPGAKVELEWLFPPTPSEPGRYTLRATYRNDPAAEPIRSGAVPPSAELLARYRATSPCEVTSNELTFHWTGR